MRIVVYGWFVVTITAALLLGCAEEQPRQRPSVTMDSTEIGAADTTEVVDSTAKKRVESEEHHDQELIEQLVVPR